MTVDLLNRMDPQVAVFFASKPGLDLTDLEGARATMLTMLDDRRPPPNPAVESTDYHAPGLPGEPDVRVRVYRPRAQVRTASLPAVDPRRRPRTRRRGAG